MLNKNRKISTVRLSVQVVWFLLIVFSLANERTASFKGTIFLATLILGPIFCGWLCVFGTYQDIMSKLGAKVLKRRYKVPRKIHNFLKAFRYILLVMTFISFLEFFREYDGRISFLRSMPKFNVASTKTNTQKREIPGEVEVKQSGENQANAGKPDKHGSRPQRPQHKLPNIPQSVLYGIIVFYGLLAFFVDRPFCSYLCGEGARYGLLGKMRFFSIKRNTSSCVSCSKCDKVCPMDIEVSKTETVQDAQCISCLSCVESCPVKKTLTVGSVFTK